MNMVQYSQAIVDSSIAKQRGEFYHPPQTHGPSDVDLILKKYKLATNPVTKSVYKDMLVNRLAKGEELS